jgi:hypothetical protein
MITKGNYTIVAEGRIKKTPDGTSGVFYYGEVIIISP